MKHSTCFFLIFIPGCVYLFTLSPSLGFQDSPEFVDTSFALGISHPAGFPTYNLMGKAITFFPFGSIAFRINFFSALFACMTLVALYLASSKMLELCFPESSPDSRVVPSLIPSCLLAFSIPFWSSSLVAEVYTLHAFFTGLIIYFLLLWKTQNNLSYLFLAALFFGLSAGNHATVAFYLPAILVLFFAWQKENKIKTLGFSVLVFLLGFSVYLYLPIRSMAEPTIDWGNPETLQNFLYQVTDRRHAELHFSEMNEASGNMAPAPSILEKAGSAFSKAGYVFHQLINDLGRQFTWLMVIGFLGGAILCARKFFPLFVFLFIITALNASFFVGWREESYFPSYIVACLWAALFFYWLLFEKLGDADDIKDSKKFIQPKKNTRFAVSSLAFACVLWLLISNYLKVDRSNNYFAESYLKKELLSADDESILVTEVSWFYMAYYLDVMRLRDDMTLVKAADFLEEDPVYYFTPRRYPELKLPDPQKYQFGSTELAFNYMMDFFRMNSTTQPVLIEQNWLLFEEFPLAEELLPHKNLLLKFPSSKSKASGNSLDGFNKFKMWLEEELKKPGLQYQPKWINKIIFYLPSFANHFHATGRYKEEREVLKVLYDFLGLRGPDWHLKMVDNLVLDGKNNEGRLQWEKMRKHFPNRFQTFLAEGLVLRSEGNFQGAIDSFHQASGLEPGAFRPYFEKSRTLLMSGKKDKAVSFLKIAEKKIKSLKDLKQIRNVQQFLEAAS
ncbi:MAG: DUF2723 domain-containing protein [Nitrospinae bacterium]|nr:DUF2723 domain-containing protein [Nitrospinota bacterium]